MPVLAELLVDTGITGLLSKKFIPAYLRRMALPHIVVDYLPICRVSKRVPNE